jgi:predicted nucleic acid-binding protein
MEQPQYLIDTNSIIDYLGKRMPNRGMDFMDTVINRIPNLSIISKIEVLGFNTVDEHYNLLLSFMNDAIVLSLSDNIVDATIDLRKKYKTKLPDAIIAATALVNNMILITRNTSDFKSIKGLKLVDPNL